MLEGSTAYIPALPELDPITRAKLKLYVAVNGLRGRAAIDRVTARGQEFVASHVTGVPMDQSLSATFLPTCSRHKPRRLIRYSTRSGDVPKCFAITADDVPFVTAD